MLHASGAFASLAIAPVLLTKSHGMHTALAWSPALLRCCIQSAKNDGSSAADPAVWPLACTSQQVKQQRHIRDVVWDVVRCSVHNHCITSLVDLSIFQPDHPNLNDNMLFWPSLYIDDCFPSSRRLHPIARHSFIRPLHRHFSL